MERPENPKDATRLTLAEVYRLSLDVLMACGATEENASPVAASIERAEADFIRNIGLGYLPTYCEHLRCGKVDGKAVPVVVQTAPSAIRVDAGQGFAHPAIEKGLPLLRALTQQNGICAMGVGNSYSAGVLGHLIEPLAEEGLLAMVFANAPAIIAPWGGKVPVFGTNPMAVAIPSKGRPPVVIDQSSSVTAKVSIFARRAKGQQLDPGWALDKTGRPTLDPREALEGSMLPSGGYKGANLALLVEALASGLTGANWSFSASPFSDNTGGPPRTGQFFIAMRPTVFGCEDFPMHIEELFAAILTQKGTQLPCAERLTARQKSAAEGVVVDNELLDRLYSYTQALQAPLQ